MFGLHGLPVPKTKAVHQPAPPGQPVDVTPDVIYSTYKVTKQKVRRSPDNRQAVVRNTTFGNVLFLVWGYN